MGERASRKRVLIIVEGPSDKGFIETLARKLRINLEAKLAVVGGDPYKAARDNRGLSP